MLYSNSDSYGVWGFWLNGIAVFHALPRACFVGLSSPGLRLILFLAFGVLSPLLLTICCLLLLFFTCVLQNILDRIHGNVHGSTQPRVLTALLKLGQSKEVRDALQFLRGPASRRQATSSAFGFSPSLL